MTKKNIKDNQNQISNDFNSLINKNIVYNINIFIFKRENKGKSLPALKPYHEICSKIKNIVL